MCVRVCVSVCACVRVCAFMYVHFRLPFIFCKECDHIKLTFSQVQMREIIEISEMMRRESENRRKIYNEIKEESFPPIGSRVRRGPDWDSDNQDNNGPGTIVGHSKTCKYNTHKTQTFCTN